MSKRGGKQFRKKYEGTHQIVVDNHLLSLTESSIWWFQRKTV